jgi:hypothetical protein
MAVEDALTEQDKGGFPVTVSTRRFLEKAAQLFENEQIMTHIPDGGLDGR